MAAVRIVGNGLFDGLGVTVHGECEGDLTALPALLIVIPLIGLLVLNLPFKREIMNRLALWFGLAFCLLEALLALCPTCWSESAEFDFFYKVLAWNPVVDNLSRVTFLAIALVSFSAFMVAKYTISDGNRLFVFSNVLLLSLTGMNGLVLAGDLFSLYIFLEVAAVCSFILIAFEQEKNAFEGAFKYFVLSAIASALILSSIALLLLFVGGLSFSEVSSALADQRQRYLVLLALSMFLTGLLVKGGVVPFHGWVPDAYSAAPSPTSVLLGGIVTKAGGIYTLIRLTTTVFGSHGSIQIMLLTFGTLSLVVGALAALTQSDFRRMLAYSSISQIGYIVLGLGTGTALGIAGAVLHFFNHSLFKSLLFVNAAAVEQQTGLRDMDRMGGLSNKMPITGISSTIAFLSTAGIPPLSGFWSKLIIVIAVWQSGHPTLATIAVLTSLLTLAYFLSLQRRVFFGNLAEQFENLKEANVWALIPALLLAALTVALGLLMPWLFGTFLLPVETLL